MALTAGSSLVTQIPSAASLLPRGTAFLGRPDGLPRKAVLQERAATATSKTL